MAVTKTHPIKSTLKAAIDYILNPEKTDGKLLASSFGCGLETADIEFAWTREAAGDRGTHLGRHLIQSFAVGETTPEEAHKIGMELAGAVLGGKYEFVLTTHVDKDHLHNHLIFNAVSFVDYKKYHSNKQSYHFIRRTSDRICKEHDLRRVTHFARMKERQFAQYINQRNTAELRREINRLQKELDSMRRRYDELSALFKRLYEDNVLGRVTNEQFRMLSADYNAEQKNLSVAIPAKEEQLEKLKASAANVDAFIEKAKRYTTIDELTPELLRLFIQRIEVGERSQKYSRSAGQSVRIVYRDIGRVDSPMQEGEHIPYITKQITDIEEIKRLLA